MRWPLTGLLHYRQPGFYGIFQSPGGRPPRSRDSTCRQGCLCKLCLKRPLLRFHRSGQPLQIAVACQSKDSEDVRQHPPSRLPASQTSRSQFRKVLLWRNPSSSQAGAPCGRSGGRPPKDYNGVDSCENFRPCVCNKPRANQPVGKLACDETRQSARWLSVAGGRVQVLLPDIEQTEFCTGCRFCLS